MFTLSAPAKINWFLNILDRRDDGYHDILSLMQIITVSDSLLFEHSSYIEVLTEAPIPVADNLVYKAAVLFQKKYGIEKGARITLKKDSPMAAGLGGGSSDAASTLMGLNRLWNLNLPKYELARRGETLGADVPFFLHGPASIAEGKGEIISTVSLGKSYDLLLVKPSVGVSTGWAYSELDKVRNRDKELTKKINNIKLFCQALDCGDFSLVASLQKNDLESLVIGRYPVVGDIKRNLMDKGALFSAMSGSGPTVFGVFDSEKRAIEAMEHMSPHWRRVVKTVI